MDANNILRECGIEPLETESHLYVNIRLAMENVCVQAFNKLPSEVECLNEAGKCANEVWSTEYLNNIYRNGFIHGTHFIKDELIKIIKPSENVNTDNAR